jgi:hypothetical protein
MTAGLIGANGTYPDLDMLPLGTCLHNDKDDGQVYGPPSPTHFTRDEQLLLMSLWCIARAPLFFGGRLPLDAGDDWTHSLLTNGEVLAAQNASTAQRVVNVTTGPSHYTGNINRPPPEPRQVLGGCLPGSRQAPRQVGGRHLAGTCAAGPPAAPGTRQVPGRYPAATWHAPRQGTWQAVGLNLAGTLPGTRQVPGRTALIPGSYLSSAWHAPRQVALKAPGGTCQVPGRYPPATRQAPGRHPAGC